MSLLDNLPHRATILNRKRSKDALGGADFSDSTVKSNVPCWVQNVSHGEMQDFEKRGIQINRRVFFKTDPGVNEDHEIQITSLDGGKTTVSSPTKLDVKSEALPDATAGMQKAFKVMVEERTGENQ